MGLLIVVGIYSCLGLPVCGGLVYSDLCCLACLLFSVLGGLVLTRLLVLWLLSCAGLLVVYLVLSVYLVVLRLGSGVCGCIC